MTEEVTKDRNKRKALPTTREGFEQAVTEQGITFRWSSPRPLVSFGDREHSPHEPMRKVQVFLLLGKLTRLYIDDATGQDWWVSPTRIRAWATDLARRAESPPLPEGMPYL